MASPPSLPSPRRAAEAPADHHRIRLPLPRSGQRKSSPATIRPPDVAAVAAEAVVRFLHNSSSAVAERDDSRPARAATPGVAAAGAAGNGDIGMARQAARAVVAVEDAVPWSAAAEVSQLNAESVALKAAAVSVATLDRIELMAAKLEAEIAAAHRAQAELQAGAGAAVRLIVERHGGHAWAEGAVGEGAAFYFTLDAREII